jgi:hypothetical protein
VLPKSDLRIDGDLGLPMRSEAVFCAASVYLWYAYWQTYICPSSSLVKVPGLHLMALRAW